MKFIVFVSFIGSLLAGCGDKAFEQTPPGRENTPQAKIPKKQSSPSPNKMTEPTKKDDAAKPTVGKSVNEQISYLANSKIAGVKPISSRTLSMKLRLTDGTPVAFKPMRKGDKRAVHEVAAYRLSRLLEIKTVPAATMREVPFVFLTTRLGKNHQEFAQKLEKSALVERNRLLGAVMQWFDNIDAKGFEKFGGKRALMNLVKQSSESQDNNKQLAASVSSMIVFDYLIGNWDRFSGGNIYFTQNGNLALLDHNSSFAPWSVVQEKRMTGLLGQTQVFKKDLIAKLHTLTKATIDQVLSGDPTHAGRPLLRDEEIILLLTRRDKIINHVDELIEIRGPEKVLVF